jgi:hypothetical protein
LRKWIVEGLRKTQPKREKNKYSKRQQLSHDGLKNPIVPNDRGQTLAILPSVRCNGNACARTLCWTIRVLLPGPPQCAKGR